MHDVQGIYSEEDSSGDEIRNNDPLQPVIRQLASVCLCVWRPRGLNYFEVVYLLTSVSLTHT